MLDTHTITLNVDALDPSITWHVTSPHVCVTVAHVSSQNSSISGSLVLHLDFLVAEPCVLSHHSSFRGRFVIPFHGNNRILYAHPCSTLEFLLTYSIAKTLLSNLAIWLSYDFLIDQFLPGCLPMCLVSAAARSPIRMNCIYDELVDDNSEYFIGAQYFLLTLALSSLFIWNLAYTQDNDTCTIVKALIVRKSSKIPSKVIDKVHKGYRDYLKQ